MKILRVIPSINPALGGTVEAVKQTSQALVLLGINVEIATMDNAYSEYDSGFPCTVHATGLGKGRYSYSRHYLDWLLANVANYDCVMVEGIWQYHSYAARKACLKHNVPYYVFIHGMLARWFKQQYPLKHLKKWIYWIAAEYKVLRDAKKVLYTTAEEMFQARKSFSLYRCNEEIISLGIAGVKGNRNHQIELFNSLVSELADNKFLLYLSRIHPIKGIDQLIKAYAAIPSISENLYLLIAGPDPVGLQMELQQLAVDLGVDDKIIWTGNLQDEVKWGAYQSAEAFILPSHQENFGMVVAEALSCGLPVLISDKVNIWREVQEDEAGIIAMDDEQGCQQLLQRWIALTEKQKDEMKVKARKCFLKRFEISLAAESLLKIIHEN